MDSVVMATSSSSEPGLLSRTRMIVGRLMPLKESFIYETASLIVSRMLMVRFSEDHGFLRRYISNGGVEVFARYADYYAKPMQALLKETYRQSAELYRNLFDPNILDWALDSSDESLSSALLHAMYLLSRWNFSKHHM